ncbi:hypothetical protein [Mariniphaga anaerophila]|nr:hypothetical protein [Mariniphaga anaerophila]
MKTKRVIWRSIGALMMGSLVLTSCVDDPEPIALNAATDVFVQKIVQNDVEKYSVAFWVYGNKDLDSVKVEGPNDESWKLEKTPSNSQLFSLYPEDEDYTETMPAEGEYVFTVKSTQADEAAITFKDKLGADELPAVTIETSVFKDSKQKTTWLEAEDADAYYVRLYDSSDKLVFTSSILSKVTEYAFGLADNGWADNNKKAEAGETYRIEVLAILYEDGATDSNRGYNVQFISIGSDEIVWGEGE